MRILIWIVTLFTLAVGAAMLVSQDWGTVRFVLPGWSVGMSVKFFVVVLFVSFIVAYLFIRLIQKAWALPGAVGQWRERRRRQRADRSLRDALMAFHEGRYALALKHAEKAYEASDHPATAALLAARAAHALRDDARYRGWIDRLADKGEEVQTAKLMTEAELAVVSHNFEEAAEKLDALQQDGRHVAVLRLALRVALALHRWDEAVRLIRQLHKHKALTEEQAQPLLCRAHLERLREHADESGGEALVEAWNAIPGGERKDRQLMAGVAPLFAYAGKSRVVRRTLESLLERLLDEQWDSSLARLYGFCGDESASQEAGEKDWLKACLSKGEEWGKKHKNDPGLLFALGRLCVASQLWGTAEGYFSASLGLNPAIDTYLALARVSEHLGRNPAEVQQYYRTAAEMAAGG